MSALEAKQLSEGKWHQIPGGKQRGGFPSTQADPAQKHTKCLLGSNFPMKIRGSNHNAAELCLQRRKSLLHGSILYMSTSVSIMKALFVVIVIVLVLNFTIRKTVKTQVVSLLLSLLFPKRGKGEASSLPTAFAHLSPVLQGACCQPDGTHEPWIKYLLYQKPHAWPIGMLAANQDQS